MTNTIGRTPEFDTWLDGMKDLWGKTAVLTRLDRAEENNFGDCEPAGDGLSEMRVFVGKPAYWLLKDRHRRQASSHSFCCEN